MIGKFLKLKEIACTYNVSDGDRLFAIFTAITLYAIEHRIVTNIALASIMFILIGFFCLSTAITLYAISRLARKTNSTASK